MNRRSQNLRINDRKAVYAAEDECSSDVTCVKRPSGRRESGCNVFLSALNLSEGRMNLSSFKQLLCSCLIDNNNLQWNTTEL